MPIIACGYVHFNYQKKIESIQHTSHGMVDVSTFHPQWFMPLQPAWSSLLNCISMGHMNIPTLLIRKVFPLGHIGVKSNIYLGPSSGFSHRQRLQDRHHLPVNTTSSINKISTCTSCFEMLNQTQTIRVRAALRCGNCF